MKCLKFFLLSIILISCQNSDQSASPVVVVTGLDGTVYYMPAFTHEQREVLEKNLVAAKADFERDPSEEHYIWLGRRTAYKMELGESIGIFSEGLERYPGSYKLLRHRGHRYISTRQYRKAIDDLTRAAELIQGRPIETEPDGIPNKLNIPLSSTQFNIWYHLGLAHYLLGDYDSAQVAYEACLEFSDNDDLYTATADWLYMTLIKLGKGSEAAALLENIREDMDIVENESYHKRLLLYKGLLSPEDLGVSDTGSEDVSLAIATQGYGLGNWNLMNGDTAKAIEIFNKVKLSPSFTSFGFLAAEAELLRLKKE